MGGLGIGHERMEALSQAQVHLSRARFRGEFCGHRSIMSSPVSCA